MKTLGLLPDRAWIWLDFPDFKHDYVKEVYRSDGWFAGCGPQTDDFHSDWTLLMVKWVQLFTRLEVSNAHNMYSAKNTIYMLHTEDIQHQHANVNPFTNVTN